MASEQLTEHTAEAADDEGIAEDAARRSPLTWVPTLYFAEGLPLYLVTSFALLMFQALSVPNDQITAALGAVGFAWVVKPLWSPFLESAPSKKIIVIITQLIGGALAAVLALSLKAPNFFMYGFATLALIAITSATHDIAADGLYIASLTKKRQAVYSGWQGCFYNLAKVAISGGLIKLVDHWMKQSGMSVQGAWSAGLFAIAATMVGLAVYHWFTLPSAANEPQENIGKTTVDVIITFFKKPQIAIAILFIVLFRLPEGQIQSIGPLFMAANRSVGGLGLPLGDMGTIYGIFGTVAFLFGSILGGYFASWLGLKRALIILILAMNLPNATFYYLSSALPTDLTMIKAAVTIEMFGYGFGFTALLLYMMQVVAPGKYLTAHYAIATGFMSLGFNLSRIISGTVQEALGYQHFFVWVLLSTLPILILAAVMPIKTDATGQVIGLEGVAGG